jgi:hypothetical protein
MSLKTIMLMGALLVSFAVTSNGADTAMGPSGGHGGSDFKDVVPEGARIVELRVWAGDVIDAIQIVYQDSAGNKVELPKRGGKGGKLNSVAFGSGEFIYEISGKYGEKVDSLTIRANFKADRFDPHFGGGGGDVLYKYTAPQGMEIMGLCGRSGDKIDAIGIIVRPRR